MNASSPMPPIAPSLGGAIQPPPISAPSQSKQVPEVPTQQGSSKQRNEFKRKPSKAPSKARLDALEMLLFLLI
ncbi:hypothetical protein VNO78_30542 [Psophocarpus tetragonolobus]|uniref:Uncharacterized protein n=1 Tax=Psophocarpus tetragonolobus TaxID=3891 RepID=A0AAN9X7A8_PSOTE